MADPNLLRTFRFRVALVQSGGGGGGGGASAGASASLGAGASASAGASLSVGASAGVSAGGGLSAGGGFSGGASLSGGAGAGISGSSSAGLSGGASLSAGASFGASAGISAGISLGIGGGGPAVLGNGAFAECSGLGIEMDVQDYLEGGRNDGVVRRAGRAKYQPLVLKRGMVFPAGGGVDGALWKWMQDTVSGVRPIARYDGIVEVLDVGEVVAARWTFTRGLPQKISGPQLNARTGEVALEELTIAHEGLTLASL